MKIVMASIGSVGDIRPLIALGTKLRNEGDEIILCVPPNFKELVCNNHFKYYSVGIDTQEALKGVAPDLMGKPITGLKIVIKTLREMIVLQYTNLKAAVKIEKPDLLLGAGLLFTGPTVSDELKIPYAHVAHVPQWLKSRYHPPIEIPFVNLPPVLNSLAWFIHEWLMKVMLSKTINGIRKNIALKPIDTFLYFGAKKLIIAMDRELCPVPRDVTEHYLQTGYWSLTEEEGIGDDLRAFIESGPAPVYIGFGSMADPSAAKTFSIIIGAIRKLSIRAVVYKGWAEYSNKEKNDNIFFIDTVPHSILFPKMKAIIHHGGAGTVWAASRAGVPQVIVPHMGDQFYWADLVYKMKLGSHPLNRSKISSSRLASSIDYALSDIEIAKNCHEMQKRLLLRNGLNEAAKKISAYCDDSCNA